MAMRDLLTTALGTLNRIMPRFGAGPAIRDLAGVAEFVGSRAAYVGQTSLYGYLKTRMGTQYTEIFQDPAFEPSLTAARHAAFFGCLEDLTIHTVALLVAQGGLPANRASGVAESLFTKAADHALSDVACDTGPATAAFAERLRGIDWMTAGDPRVTFRSSEAVLVAAAPVINSYREADREVIENSVRFRWIDVRRQLQERLSAPDVVSGLRDA